VIQLVSATKRFGEKVLFEDVTWQINPGDRVGLVGPNGSGKTTLLRILAGQESLDHGVRSAAKTAVAGYLPQHGLELKGRTVFAECLSVFDRLKQAEVELEFLARRMSQLDPASAEYAEVAHRFHRLEYEFRAQDGYALEAQVGTVLCGLGFPKEDWYRPVAEFSGGWQMRVALAKLLLEKPDLLLLDEPTNHLDLEARNWLEDYLNSYPHAFVLVSHDRYFLDVTVRQIAEIRNRRLDFYTGNFTDYLRQKQQRREQLEAAWRKQQERVAQLETFISRFRYQASKARQVQSRIKELERMERIERPPEEPRAIHFRFPQPQPSGRIVAELCRASKHYGSRRVLEDVSLTIERGDRVALVGPNGAGKSTLIRLLAGLEPPSSGQVRLGHNVTPDYFAQDQYRELDPGVRLLEEVSALAPRATVTELRNLLGCFLFSEDDVFKTVGVLSGGERNRFALARMLLRPSNFLLLDEPTNHLDLRAKDVLLEALQQYSGTLVFVSHDRYFIDHLATKIFEVGGGGVRVYPGNYEDYIWRKSAEQPPPQETPQIEINAQQAPQRRPAARPRRLNPIRLQQMKELCRQVEDEISKLESEIASLESELANFSSAEQTIRLKRVLEERRNELGRLLGEWESLSLEIEAAESS